MLAIFTLYTFLLVANFGYGYAHKNTACEGQSLNIHCPSGELIRIISANYGRTAPGIVLCPLKGHDSHTTCFTGNSRNTVSNICEGKQQCSVPATNSVFGDPCVGTYKYLEVEHICVTSKTIACEGQTLNLNCPVGEFIQLKSANYGRTAPGSAICPLSGHDSHIGCYSANSLSIVRNLCQEKHECSVPVTNRVFGDPCVGTHKYLEVEYTCVNYHVKACENGQLHLACQAEGVINIKSANYGRTLPGSILCPLSNHDTVTGCYSSNSLDIVKNICQKQEQCTITASNGVFGDPCVGTYKYLDVEYNCVKYNQIACEGQTLSLQCNNGEVLEIVEANYGRTVAGSVCPMNGLDVLTNCYSHNSIKLVKTMCEKKQMCNVPATNSVFGDPCAGTYKYLAVTYNCI